MLEQPSRETRYKGIDPQNSIATHRFKPRNLLWKTINEGEHLHPPRSSSTRRPHLAALTPSTPDLLIILIRRNLASSLRRLVHWRRRIPSLISRRWRHEVAVLHAVAVRVLLAVVWILLLVGVHGRSVVVGIVVARTAGAAAQHPGVVAERWEILARASAGVHVAAEEVGEEEEEEDCDDGIADGGAGLGRGMLAGKGRVVSCWVV